MQQKLAVTLALFCIFVIAVAAFQQTPMNSVSITNSTVNSTPIGAGTASTGSFTNLQAGGTTLGTTQVNGAVTATGGFNGNLNGNASSASAVPWAGVSGTPAVTRWNWGWSGQPGQPNYLWGSNDGFNMYVWTPSNFSVNYANSAGSVPWGGISGIPYPVSPTQVWHWAPQGGQAYMWGTPDAQNMYPYDPGNFSVNYAANTNWAGVAGKPPVTTWNWQWSGQPGQPSWLWGSNDGATFQVWNPSNFNVNYAANAPWGGVSGKPVVTTWNWSTGQPGGQPVYTWGTNDGVNEFLWQTGTLNVSHAATTDTATKANRLVNDATGADGRFKMWQTGATCVTPPSSSYGTCTQILAIPGGWYGAGWFIVCSGGSVAQGYPKLITAGPTDQGHFLYMIANGTANGGVPSQYNFLTCMSWGG